MAEGDVTYSSGNSTLNAPVVEGDSVYGYNKCRKSECGHQFQEDDSWGHEIIMRQHCTGTHDIYTPDGGRTVYVNGPDYEIIIKDKNLVVNGTLNIVAMNECHITANKTMTINAYKDPDRVLEDGVTPDETALNVNVFGDRVTKVYGNDFLDVTGDFDVNAGENHKLRTKNVDQNIEGEYRQRVYKDVSVNWNGDKNKHVIKNGFRQSVGNEWLLQASMMDIRGGASATGNEELLPPSYDVIGPGIHMSSADNFMMSAGFGKDITIQNGDLNLTFGSINLVLGSVTTFKGDFKTTLGKIETNFGDIEAKLCGWSACSDGDGLFGL